MRTELDKAADGLDHGWVDPNSLHFVIQHKASGTLTYRRQHVHVERSGTANGRHESDGAEKLWPIGGCTWPIWPTHI